eukprot:TRINITY_DN17385_c0_g1_i1.p1 TRINITY_DN17385_c0_g1~~TRINITY_DN17385_c0_g1_i1.p1  ORF type:complete len:462 (-),score=119.44 TRINITY_DN17385_c0_g1_i1:128-1513(-)
MSNLVLYFFFFFQAEDGIRDAQESRGLGDVYKRQDKDKSDSLELPEFKKGLALMQLGLAPHEELELFNWLDHDGNQSVSYTEFLAGLRGPMAGIRRSWIHAAFNKLDADGSGVVNLDDLRGVYDATNHPKVLRKEMTEEQVLLEFLDTFGDNSVRGNSDGQVTLQEFSEYYANVGASIESDEFFGEMMRAAWKLGDEQNVDHYKFLRRSKPSPALGGVKQDPAARAPYASEVVTPRGLSDLEAAKLLGISAVLDKLRRELAASSGSTALIRQLRQHELHNNGLLSQPHFEAAVGDVGQGGGSQLNPGELSVIWDGFGGASGAFDIDKFAQTLQVHLSEGRKRSVRRAFDSLDHTRQGWVPLQLIADRYNAMRHPEVTSGKLTEQEERGRFIRDFVGCLSSQYVRYDEWERLYGDVSAGIEDDNYFNLLLWNTWDKGGELRDGSKPENLIPDPANNRFSRYY